MKGANFSILDCETGGLDYLKNPITQFAVIGVSYDNFDEIDRFETHVKPYGGLEIEAEALKHSMVDMSEIERGMDIVKLVNNIISFVKKINISGKSMNAPIIVGHNIPFDIDFLEYAFHTFAKKNFWDYFSRNYVDTQALAKLELGKPKSGESTSLKLIDVCKRLGIELTDAHGAMNDVIATKKVLGIYRDRLTIIGGAVETTAEGKPKAKSREFFQF